MPSPTIHFAGPDAQVLVLTCDPHFTDPAAAELHALACRHLPDRDDSGIVLDFSETVQLYSMGITAILRIRSFCQERGVPLVLAGLAPNLIEFFAMIQVQHLFNIESSLDEAIARAGQGA